MENAEPSASRSATRLQAAGAALGAASTALTLFVAVTSYATDRKVARLEAESAAVTARLSGLSLRTAAYESASRVAAEFGVYNAREFAATLSQVPFRIDFPDPETARAFERQAARWGAGRGLMDRGPTEQVLLRQVVWLRLTNLGRTPARDVRLAVRQRDFDADAGEPGPAFDQLAGGAGWAEREVRLSDLAAGGQEARDMPPQVLVPVAHVAGGTRYYGRVSVPVRVRWRDELTGRDTTVALDLAGATRLRNALGSAMLGHMARRGSPECLTAQ